MDIDTEGLDTKQAMEKLLKEWGITVEFVGETVPAKKNNAGWITFQSDRQFFDELVKMTGAG